MPQTCPGREGGHGYLEHSPDVSRRLAIEVDFVEAASFFNKLYIYLYFLIYSLCVTVHRGEAFPLEGKGPGHREEGRWVEAQSRSWTGTEAVHPQTEKGQWRARLGSCWMAAIEQKRQRGLVTHAVHAERPSMGTPGAQAPPQPQDHPLNQGPSSEKARGSERKLREAGGQARPA